MSTKKKTRLKPSSMTQLGLIAWLYFDRYSVPAWMRAVFFTFLGLMIAGTIILWTPKQPRKRKTK